MVLVRAGEGQRLESRQSNTVEDIKVPAGEAVDIFYRYGPHPTTNILSLVNIFSQDSSLSRFGWCPETTTDRG